MTVTASEPALVRITREDPIGQLRQHTGLMAALGSERDRPMLDWVEAVPRALADGDHLERVEAEARNLLAQGIHHLVWAGMGGSVLTVRVLRALGFCGGSVTIHPLDSTDPAALNALLDELARAHGMSLPEWSSSAAEAPVDASDPALCHRLFADVAMVGVAMGMTSEEPISHLEWFAGLLEQGGLALSDHLLVMSIPGSYLEHYASSHRVPSLPLQLDGGAGTPGRMSAPATRVFLLPVALDLAARGAAPGTLRTILRHAWAAYDLDGAAAAPARHRYVRLAATLADAAVDGVCALYVDLPAPLESLRWWMEQLMEESLGKGGKGIVVFADQSVSAAPPSSSNPAGAVRLQVSAQPEDASSAPPDGAFLLSEPLLGAPSLEQRLAGLATVFLGLQLSMVLYGYLHEIHFAGQPAVEDYKRRTRELREAGNPLQAGKEACAWITEGALTLLPPPEAPSREHGSRQAAASAERRIAASLSPSLRYLDLTINGEMPEHSWDEVERHLRYLGNVCLGVPVKLRRAPASYHSTEQSEMDGPDGVVSLRVLAEHHPPCLLGEYDDTFLQAQAVGTWMAMNGQGRACYLLVYDAADDALGPALYRLLDALAQVVTT